MLLQEIRSDLTLQSLEFMFVSSWENWLELTSDCNQFFKCKLKIALADYKVGDEVPWIAIDTSNSTITLPDSTDTIRIYHMIADKITVKNI